MKIFRWLLASFVLMGLPLKSFALDPRDYTIAVTAQVQASPPQIKLQWPENPMIRQYVVRRKAIQDTGWGSPIATLPGNATGFADSQVAVGTSYEYEIQAPASFFPWPNGDSSKWITAWAYLNSGIEVPVRDNMGKVLLLVDSTVAASLAGELQEFAMDLVGAGWQVLRRDVSTTASVSQVRSLVQAEYNADPGNLRSVILFGHLPVPYSGSIAPDMHEGHRGAWPADVVYADINGNFTDDSVNITSSEYPENRNVPGDGKFDQSSIPSSVELEIGRIDMWNLPAFSPRTETDLLRRYLQKNHSFRHKEFNAVRRALVRDNFGDLDGDAPAVDAWRFFPTMVGPNMINAVESGQFFPRLNADTYLWAYGGGGGSYDKADGVGSTMDFASNDPKAVFYILHGSYFGDFNNENNFLRAAPAVQNYGLASIWSGLPHWYLHHLSLGQTLGYAARLAQNNQTLYKSQFNYSAGQVHIGLIGDPTLPVFTVAPPSNLSGRIGVGATLSWSPPAEPVGGYLVYYSQNEMGPYQRLTPTLNTVTTFSQRGINSGTHYFMVRAVKLESTPSGTFYNASQGAFIKLVKDGVPPELPVISLTIDDGDASEVGPNGAIIRATRSIATAESLVVHLDISGAAVNGIDYQTIPASVTIDGGTAVGFINIAPLQDTLKEGDENVQIMVKPSSAYTVGSLSAASIIIKDNYANQPPFISAIADQVIDQNSPGPTIAFTLSDADTPAGDLTITASSSNQALIPNANLVLEGSGASRTIRATPALNQAGTSAITITASDGGLTAGRTFNLTVRPANRGPTANNQAIQLEEDTQISILLSGTDPDGNNLTYSIVTAPQKGALSGNPPNVIYKPQANWNGSDSFTFRVSDGILSSDLAAVQITITPVNDAPVAAPQAVELPEEGAKPITLAGTDIEADALNFIIKTQPLKGSLTGTPPNLIYNGNLNATGTDSFAFAVSDGKGESAAATVSITITPQNDPPTITSIAQLTLLQGQNSIPLPFQVSDPDNIASTLVVTGRSSNEALLQNDNIIFGGTNGDRTVVIKPNPSAIGSATVTMRVSDGQAFSETSFELKVLDVTPRITSLLIDAAGTATILFQGMPRARYEVQSKSTSHNEWQLLVEGTADAEGKAEARDTTAKNIPFRIYRVEWP